MQVDGGEEEVLDSEQVILSYNQNPTAGEKLATSAVQAELNSIFGSKGPDNENLKENLFLPQTGTIDAKTFYQMEKVYESQQGKKKYSIQGTGNASIQSFSGTEVKTPGTFESVDAAAVDFGIRYSIDSSKDDREYFSYIYKINNNGNTYYSFSSISKLDERGGSTPSVLELQKEGAIPENVDVVAGIHTHGAYLSELGKNDLQFSNSDETWSNYNGIPIYLANAAGELLKYDHSGYSDKYGKTHPQVFLISSDLPKQSNYESGTGYHPVIYKEHPWYYYLWPGHWGEDKVYPDGTQ